jgi:outer membrane protein OmpA-like peptidoglycan-associated protein
MRLLLFAIMLLAPSISVAQQAVEIETSRLAQHGYGDPSITFKPNVSGQLEVSLQCGNRPYSLDATISPGKNHIISFSGLGVGAYDCAGMVRLRAEDGSSGEMPINIHIELLAPLELSVDPEHLNLEKRTLRVRASRPLDRVRIDVRGLKEVGGVVGGIVGKIVDGKLEPAPLKNTTATFLLGSTETSVARMLETDVEWTQLDDNDEVLQIEVTGWDQQNFPGQVLLFPWSYSIPHEDVVFRTGSAVIDAPEVPKLQQAYDELQQVLTKYGDIVIVKLYVAGYTDTVGNPDSNQDLSQNRAASIASWFQQVGFEGPIFYQGFGETVLAVPSGDEIAEARNRRAIYLLAADIPSISDEVPRNIWTQLSQ